MSKIEKVRILIADDFKDLRDLIRMQLEKAGDLQVVGEVPDLEDALASALVLQPDVIIMNDYLPPMDSAHASALFQKKGISSAILVAAGTLDYFLIVRCFLNGVKGFIHKDEIGDHLVDAVRRIYQGEQYFSPRVRAVYGNNAG